MHFKAPHVSFVSFAVEILASGITQVQHPAYNDAAVEALISAAKIYTKNNIEGASAIRLVSTRSGEI